MCLPLATGSGGRSYNRVKAGQGGGEYDIFIEQWPRRYRPGHPNYVPPIPHGEPLQPGQAIPAHIDPTTGKPKSSRIPRAAFVVRRKTEVDNQHERGELGHKYKSGQWNHYHSAGGAQFRGGRFFGDAVGPADGHDNGMGPPGKFADGMGHPGGPAGNMEGPPGNAGEGQRFGQNVGMEEVVDDFE